MLPTHLGQLSATFMCQSRSLEGLRGTTWTRTKAGRGWGGEKSAVGVGRGVSERSSSVALAAEMGSGAISSQSCVYCLDFCNSSPPESVYQ